MKKQIPLRVKIDLNKLKEYANAGMLSYQISELMNSSRATIEGHAKRNGIFIKTNKDQLIEKEKEICSFLSEGKTIKQIRSFGYCYEFIKKIAKKNNIQTDDHKSSAQKRIAPISKIKKRITEIHGDTILIDESTYIKTNNHAKFIDKEYGEFINTVSHVLEGQRHPERAKNASSLGQSQFILSNGESLRQFTERNEMSYTHVLKMAQRHGIEFAEKWISSYKDKTSELELKIKEIAFNDNIICEHIGKASTREVKRVFRNGDNSNQLKFWRPDFKITNKYNGKVIFLEADGLIFHSEPYKENNYHFKKRLDFNEQGFDLLQLRQDEIVFKIDIVKSIINAKLGCSQRKFYAKNLIIKEVDHKEAMLFLKEYHLMGEHSSSKSVGLYNSDELICLITYKKHKTGADISRFCSKIGCSIAGGLSKLISHIIKTNPDYEYIMSYVDLRYGNGNSLISCGFSLDSVSLGFKWSDKVRTYNRSHCTANMDSRGLSEAEHAKELGLDRIYDAGQAKFIKTIKTP